MKLNLQQEGKLVVDAAKSRWRTKVICHVAEFAK